MTTRLVVQLTNLVGGAADAFLTNGPVVGLGANVYPLLKRKSIKLTPAKLCGPTGGFKTEFPELTFEVLDKEARITRLMRDNRRYVYACLVTYWFGDADANFSTYKTLFFGWLEVPQRTGLRLAFTCGSVFRRLTQPSQPLTGQAELAAALNDPTALTCSLKQAVNAPINGTNVLTNGDFELGPDGSPITGWTDASGGFIQKSGLVGSNTGTRAAVNTDNGTTTREIWQEFACVGGRLFSGTAFVNSQLQAEAAPAPGNQYQIVSEVRDGPLGGGSVLSTYDTGLIARPPNIIRRIHDPILGDDDVEVQIWVQDGREFITDETATHVRLRLILKNVAASGQKGAFDTGILQSAYTARINREVLGFTGITASGPNVGQAKLGARGMFGSYPMSHKVGDEVAFFIPLRGHVCDVIRRLCTTTATGGNGAYDHADGVGQGQYFPDFLLDHSVFDAQKALNVATGNPLTDYDHRLYQVHLEVDQRIPNTLEYIETELLAPFAANLTLTPAGKLGIVIHTAVEAPDGSVLDKASLDPNRQLFEDESPREEVVNQVIYLTDFDPTSTNDRQGGISSGNDKYLNERFFDESLMGQDDQATSQVEFGVLPVKIQSKGIRSSVSVQQGILAPLNGDRIMYERARVMLTRWRFPLQRYTTLRAALAKVSTVSTGSKPLVTTAAMTDGNLGQFGRTAHVMFCEGVGFDFEGTRIEPVLLATQDIVPIPNTNVADAMLAPLNGDWRLFVPPTLTGKPTGTQSNDFVGVQWRGIKRYARNYANLSWLELQWNIAGQNPKVGDNAPRPARVTSIPVDSGVPANPVTVAAPPVGGTQATAHVAGGAIVVDNPGLGYDQFRPPAVTVGGGATAHAVMTVSDYQSTLVQAYATLEPTNNSGAPTRVRGFAWEAGRAYVVGDVVFSPPDTATANGYFWRSLTNHADAVAPVEGPIWTAYPSAAQWATAQELFDPAVETHVLFWSAASSLPAGQSQRLYVRLAYRNKDWAVGPFSDTKQVASNVAFDLGDRNPRKKIFQISQAGEGPQRTSWVMG